MVMGTRMSTRGGKKRGTTSLDDVIHVQDNNRNNFVSPSSRNTTQPWINTERRVIESKNVDTESSQISGRNLSPLQSLELVDKDCSRSLVGADFRYSTLQLGEAPTPVLNSPPYRKSVSHEPKRVEKEVTMDGIFKCASGGTDQRKSRLSQSVIPSLKGFKELNFSENSSDSLVEVLASNLQAKSPLPWSMNSLHSPKKDNMEPAYNSEESRNEEVSKVNKNGPSGYYSLNTIQMVEVLEEMGDDDEAYSLGPNDLLVPVKGYKVKFHHAGLLTSIISKHGDIGTNGSMLSVKFCSICMEQLCEIVQKLKNKKLKSITDKELESMMGTVSDLEKEMIDVGWLRKRLDDISEAKKEFLNLKPCSDLKQLHTEKFSQVKKIKEELQEYRRTLLDLQLEVKSAETALFEAETELSTTGDLISDITLKVKRVFRLESLGDDLV